MIGALNFSILDGWWAEAFNGRNGFAIGNGTQHLNADVTDTRDADHLISVLRLERGYERAVAVVGRTLLSVVRMPSLRGGGPGWGRVDGSDD